MSKETFTATIELTGDEAQKVREAAAFYRMDLPRYLSSALLFGLGRWPDELRFRDQCDKAEMPTDAESPAPPAENRIIDDDIPF
jgi:hypothetical protein